MKAIKSILICAITSLTIQSVAQAQSTPEFCQIHAGNVNRYVSEYNIFNHSAPTIYRPFIFNNKAYEINQQLAAKPLFYVAMSNGNIAAAFQLKGKYGNDSIPDRDVVTQHIIISSTNSYSEILGFCVNGTFASSPKTLTLDLYKLPLETQSALQEAKLGISRERVSNMFR